MFNPVHTVQTVYSVPSYSGCLGLVYLSPGFDGHVKISMRFKTPYTVLYLHE